MVLGIQWLKSLGPITWDFETLKMQFQLQHQMVTLKGLVGGAIHIASKKQVAKMSFVGGKVLVLCF